MKEQQLMLPEGIDKETEQAYFEFGYPIVTMIISERVCRTCGEPMYDFIAYNPQGFVLDVEEECIHCGCPIGMLGTF